MLNREQLQTDYVWNLIEGMDISDLTQLAHDKLMDELDELADAEFLDDVKTYYPELLEGLVDESERTAESD